MSRVCWRSRCITGLLAPIKWSETGVHLPPSSATETTLEQAH